MVNEFYSALVKCGFEFGPDDEMEKAMLEHQRRSAATLIDELLQEMTCEKFPDGSVCVAIGPAKVRFNQESFVDSGSFDDTRVSTEYEIIATDCWN